MSLSYVGGAYLPLSLHPDLSTFWDTWIIPYYPQGTSPPLYPCNTPPSLRYHTHKLHQPRGRVNHVTQGVTWTNRWLVLGEHVLGVPPVLGPCL